MWYWQKPPVLHVQNKMNDDDDVLYWAETFLLVRGHDLDRRKVIKALTDVQYAVEQNIWSTVEWYSKNSGFVICLSVLSFMHRGNCCVWAFRENVSVSSGCGFFSFHSINTPFYFTAFVFPNNQYGWETAMPINASISHLYPPHPLPSSLHRSIQTVD